MGRRYPTTNQRNTKMIVIMMIMIIVIIIIINIIMSVGLPNHPKQIQTCRREPPNPHHATGGQGWEPPKPTPEPHHTTGRGEATHNHTTPQAGEGSNPQPHHTTGGGEPLEGGEGGGSAEPGSYIYIYIYVCVCVYVYLHVCMYVCMGRPVTATGKACNRNFEGLSESKRCNLKSQRKNRCRFRCPAGLRYNSHWLQLLALLAPAQFQLDV